MKKKKGFIATAVLAICSLLLISGCKNRHHDRSVFALDYVSEALDLTEAQEKKLDSIREELVTEVEKLHQDKEQIHDTLKIQLTGETIDKDIIRQFVADHRLKMDSIIELAIDKLADFHLDLTPEQRTKLVAKLEKFEKYHHHPFKK